ncbi:MAG TPA: hypothetical protein VMR06_02000 [Dokdonella sp.]|uniref:hypothetical protein n=1 Tax=Dokdonella sp. TaxID=2291710 RepID=UPI002BC0CB70|nr:hypothetical protein [Dokdonella sp.]HUD40748.1 hypothetical protein [Dokdonella sp.]
MDLLSEIISFFIGAAAGSLLTVTVKSMRAGGHGTNVDQSKASAGGDIVGGDKKN